MLKFEMVEKSGMQTTPWRYNTVEILAAVVAQKVTYRPQLLGYFRQIRRSWHTRLTE